MSRLIFGTNQSNKFNKSKNLKAFSPHEKARRPLRGKGHRTELKGLRTESGFTTESTEDTEKGRSLRDRWRSAPVKYTPFLICMNFTG